MRNLRKSSATDSVAPFVFRLRHIPPGAVAQHNRIAAAAPAGEIPLNGPNTRFRWAALSDAHGPAWSALHLSGGGQAFQLVTSVPLCAALFPTVAAGGRNIATDSEALLLEHALSPALAKIETALETSLTVDGLSQTAAPVPEATSLTFSVEIEGHADPVQAALLGLPEAWAERLITQFATSRLDGPAAVDIPLKVKVLSEELPLLQEDFNSLEIGDLLTFPGGISGITPASVLIAHQLRAGLRRRTRGYALTESPMKIPAEEAPMPTPRNRTAPSPEGGALDITLSVELEQITVKMSDLQTWREGTVVPLSKEVTPKVRLLADGKAVAEGELVTIGDTSGVQIVRFF